MLLGKKPRSKGNRFFFASICCVSPPAATPDNARAARRSPFIIRETLPHDDLSSLQYL